MCTWGLTHSTGEGGRRSTEGSNRHAVTSVTHCSWGPAEFHSAKQIKLQFSQTSVSATGLLHSCEELMLWQCRGLLKRRSVWTKNGKEQYYTGSCTNFIGRKHISTAILYSHHLDHHITRCSVFIWWIFLIFLCFSHVQLVPFNCIN